MMMTIQLVSKFEPLTTLMNFTIFFQIKILEAKSCHYPITNSNYKKHQELIPAENIVKANSFYKNMAQILFSKNNAHYSLQSMSLQTASKDFPIDVP